MCASTLNASGPSLVGADRSYPPVTVAGAVLHLRVATGNLGAHGLREFDIATVWVKGMEHDAGGFLSSKGLASRLVYTRFCVRELAGLILCPPHLQIFARPVTNEACHLVEGASGSPPGQECCACHRGLTAPAPLKWRQDRNLRRD